MSGEVITATEYQIYTKSGELRWVRITRHPVWDADDQHVVRLYNIAQDVTKEKAALSELEASRERYRMISELISDFAFSMVLSPTGDQKVEWVTGAFQRITGYDEQAILDSDSILVHPGDVQKYRDEFSRVIQGQTIDGSEYRIITQAGEQRWLQVSRLPDWDEQEQRVIRVYCVGQDITYRKRTEVALIENEERFRLITQATSNGLYDCDLVNNLVWRNDWYNRYLGRTEAVSGRGIWSKRIHPDDYEATMRSHRAALASDATSWIGEYRLRNQEDQYRTFLDRTYIVRDDKGEALRAIGAITDITERRAYDQRAMDLRVQTERIQVLTGLVRAMSHDFRTPLTVINTSIYLLNRTDDPERQQYHLAKIQDQVMRLEKLIDGLRTMALLDADDAYEFTSVDVNRLVDYVQSVQQSACDAKEITLQVYTADNLPAIEGDDNWLDRAFTNLVENAIQFTPTGNQITLRTYRREDDVILEVEDTGVGMTAEQQEAVFTPLYRGAEHRPADNAYGLGLTITHKIVSAHHGRIELESIVDKGTTFRLLFPVKTL